MSEPKHTPGIRLDRGSGQYFPTVDGVDQSPTSFEEAESLRTASRIAIAGLREELAATVRSHDAADARCLKLEAQRDELLAALNKMLARLEYVTRHQDFTNEVESALNEARAAVDRAKGNQ